MLSTPFNMFVRFEDQMQFITSENNFLAVNGNKTGCWTIYERSRTFYDKKFLPTLVR